MYGIDTKGNDVISHLVFSDDEEYICKYSFAGNIESIIIFVQFGGDPDATLKVISVSSSQEEWDYLDNFEEHSSGPSQKRQRTVPP